MMQGPKEAGRGLREGRSPESRWAPNHGSENVTVLHPSLVLLQGQCGELR